MPTRALLSVWDKTGIVAFARSLAEFGIELLSTGGTRAALAEAGIESTELSDHMGFPEILDGRVKTLHPKVHGGILARDDVDAGALREHGIAPIDLVVVNLYPFAAAGVTRQEALAHIDIGGPTLLRGAAKNHARVAVVAHPADYGEVIDTLRAGGPTAAMRFDLGAKAFAHTAAYDAAIAAWFEGAQGGPPPGDSPFPPRLTLSYSKRGAMRYGENPHQQAAFYVEAGLRPGTVGGGTQLAGAPLSYNNVVDVDAALQCVAGFDAPACAIVKHAAPCGVAVAATPRGAYAKAHAADPASAFGGVVAFNRAVGADTLQAVLDAQFVEAIAAPEVDAAAVAGLRKAVRVLAVGPLGGAPAAIALKQVGGGLLLQEADAVSLAEAPTAVTARSPTPEEKEDLLFAWRVAACVKSNAIVIAQGGASLGIGGGQTSRVGSVRVAVAKAQREGHAIAGAALASDAFFPFPDGVEVAARAGVRAIIQPGGSKRDAECIAAADAHGVAMVFTGVRHFRH